MSDRPSGEFSVEDVHVPPEQVGRRADTGLSQILGLPRTQVARLIEGGHATVDGAPLAKSSKLTGEVVTVELVAPDVGTETAVPMEILYEDEHLIVINKPVGVAAHKNPGWNGPTVLESLRKMGVEVSKLGPPERRGIVSRLDVGTSGAMVVAKSDLAYSGLKRAFSDRAVHRKYHALVEGHPDPVEGVIDAPIARHPSRQWRFGVVEGGRQAITHYEVVEHMAGGALVELHLETGRTHQIRVHMSAINHPCLGDVFYGADPVRAERLGLDRQWLHAVQVGFEHPGTGEMLTVEAPYPDDLKESLATLRDGLW